MWLESAEGISDLRRFWHGRREDFSLSELVAFYDTLPVESATVVSYSDYTVPVQTVLLALLADNISGVAHILSGKRMRQSDMVLKLFRKINNAIKQNAIKQTKMSDFSDLKKKLLEKKTTV